jgi:hypothetical protein
VLLEEQQQQPYLGSSMAIQGWGMHSVPTAELECTKLLLLAQGDITALACSDTSVYAATADGYLRSWTIGKGGRLTQVSVIARVTHP